MSGQSFINPCNIMNCIPPNLNLSAVTINGIDIPKFVDPLIIPETMPNNGTPNSYRISARKIKQQILPLFDVNGVPTNYGPSDVLAYGTNDTNHSFPSMTIEAISGLPITVEWVNELMDVNGNYLPHFLPIDQTLHWSNPPGGMMLRDTDLNKSKQFYTGPIPLVTHLHGTHTFDHSDGYAEAWVLPNAKNIDPTFATVGSKYNYFQNKYLTQFPNELPWAPGTSRYYYSNDNFDSDGTFWFHDHSMGMTRINVYSGLVGFYLLRGNPNSVILDSRTGNQAVLPNNFNPNLEKRELPMVINDKTFNLDGTLFFPSNRSYHSGLTPDKFNLPTKPDTFVADPNGVGIPVPDPTLLPVHPGMVMQQTPLPPGVVESDINPIYNTSFFGNTILVNGKTWPYHIVNKQRYRMRICNGCNHRSLILHFGVNKYPFAIIGVDGSILADKPAIVTEFVIQSGQRFDFIMDFSQVIENEVILYNTGPDVPLKGAKIELPDPITTGLVMKFIINQTPVVDETTPIEFLQLPPPTPLLNPLNLSPTIRNVTLKEYNSNFIYILEDKQKNPLLDANGVLNRYIPGNPIPPGYTPSPFGPIIALLGTFNTATNVTTSYKYMEPVTEDPVVNVPEIWRIYNFTGDAHPVHIHLVQFKVLSREPIDPTIPLKVGPNPLPWESNTLDLVTVYPDEITTVQLTFDLPGLYVWHCHMIDHEDNELMRPIYVKTSPNEIVNINTLSCGCGCVNCACGPNCNCTGANRCDPGCTC